MTWTLNNYDRLFAALVEHVWLVGLALAISLVVALPLGIVSARRPRLYAVTVAVTGVLYTVPALALFALLIPFMGLGTAPAVTALVLYSLLILVREGAEAMLVVAALAAYLRRAGGADAGVGVGVEALEHGGSVAGGGALTDPRDIGACARSRRMNL